MAQVRTPNKHTYPFRLLDLDKGCQKIITGRFLGKPSGLKSVNHWGFRLPVTTSLEEIESAYNHPLDPRDVWLLGPPKCGTTWTQELVWLIANDLDYKSTSRPLMGSNGRWSFNDLPIFFDKEFFKKQRTTDQEKSMAAFSSSMTGNTKNSSSRFIKTHLPLSMNNPELLSVCKVVYVARNPKDACLSYFHHCRLMKTQDYTEDFETFVQDFMDGNVAITPFVEHMIEAWNLRHHPNMCMIFFEDMKKDMPSQIRKVAKFLGKILTNEQIEKLADFLKFDSLKAHREGGGKQEEQPQFDFIEKRNPIMYTDRGSFFRKGETGDWKNHFTPEMNQKFNKWLCERLKGTDLKFVEELDHQS